MKNSWDVEINMSVQSTNTMRHPRIEKVVVHMGVGEAGKKLQNAEEILRAITGQDGVQTISKSTIAEFGIRKGDPIGAKVTLRSESAVEFLKLALPHAKISPSSFDNEGNLSFGLSEHIVFPDQDYNPSIGLYGLDVTVVLNRAGSRIKRRRRSSKSIPISHRLTTEESVNYIESTFNVEVQSDE